MNSNVEILLAEDDEGHAELIRKNLVRAGVGNGIRHFHNGEEVLRFLGADGGESRLIPGTGYVLLLDIRMPRVNGVEVLRTVKANEELRKIPVMMITTSDDPREIERCHVLGCSSYITKPIDYESFVNAIRRLGQFLSVVEVPSLREGS